MSQNQNQNQRQDITSTAGSSSSSSFPSSPEIPTGEQRSQERLQMIDNMKAPIIQMGKTAGYEIIENYDLGAGPIHVTWIFKPGDSESFGSIFQ
jgi:hypothetical protein